MTGAAGAFTVSDTGVLAYQTGSGAVRSQLVWHERGGKQTSVLGDQADYADVELSPDDQRVAVSVLDPAQGTRDLWLYDVKRGLRTRFTFDAANEFEPIWSPDGDRLAFSRNKESVDLYQKPSSGSGSEGALLEGGLGKFPADWSPDGRFILYMAGGAAIGRSDLLVLPLFGDRKPFPFLESSFVETRGQFSPDGRWIAYASNESGQLEIYVARFPEPGERRRVSTAGGLWPRWRRDGTELVYLAPDNTLTAATVNGEGATFEVRADPNAVRGASSPDGLTRRLSVRRLRRWPALSRQHSGRRDRVGGHHTRRELDGRTEEMKPTPEALSFLLA